MIHYGRRILGINAVMHLVFNGNSGTKIIRDRSADYKSFLYWMRLDYHSTSSADMWAWAQSVHYQQSAQMPQTWSRFEREANLPCCLTNHMAPIFTLLLVAMFRWEVNPQYYQFISIGRVTEGSNISMCI